MAEDCKGCKHDKFGGTTCGICTRLPNRADMYEKKKALPRRRCDNCRYAALSFMEPAWECMSKAKKKCIKGYRSAWEPKRKK